MSNLFPVKNSPPAADNDELHPSVGAAAAGLIWTLTLYALLCIPPVVIAVWRWAL